MVIRRQQPIADQVLDVLRQRIRDREFGPDNRLPSESELAVNLGVSRATIRTALSALATEKLIVRKQGNGTFVNKRFLDITTQFGTIWEFTSMIEANGQISSIESIKIDKRVASKEESEALEIQPLSQVTTVVRIFLANGRPAIYSTNVIPQKQLCQELDLKQIEDPLPDFFKKFCHQEFTYGISHINAAFTDATVAKHLGIEVGSPILRFVEVFYNADDLPLVYAVNFFNDQVLKLRVARSFS